jgi:hypothetical protein
MVNTLRKPPALTRTDLWSLGILLFLTLGVRLVTPMVLHTGIDARDYWNSALFFSRGLPYPELTHRTVRWTLILPVALGQILFGTGPNVGYFVPWTFQLLQTFLFFVIGRRMFSTEVGVLAALGSIFFPYSIRAGSQIMPESVSVTYVLAALWFFLSYLSTPNTDRRNQFRSLVLLALFVFIAYSAKITNLYIFPGFVLGLWIFRRSLAPALVFSAILAGLYGLETLGYAIFSEYPLGHLQIITQTHFSDAIPYPYSGFFSLFLRYSSAHLQLYWQIPIFLFFGLGIIFCIRPSWFSKELRILLLLGFSFFFLITFGFRSLDPLRLIERFLNRYLLVGLGFVILTLAAVFVQGIHTLFPRFSLSTVLLPGLSTIALLALVGIPLILLTPQGQRAGRFFAWNPRDVSTHPLILNNEYSRLLGLVQAGQLPLVVASNAAGSNTWETARTFYMPRPLVDLPSGTYAIGDGTYKVIGTFDPGSANFLAGSRGPFTLRVVDQNQLSNGVRDRYSNFGED